MGFGAAAHQVLVGFVGEVEVSLVVDKLLLFAWQLARSCHQCADASLYFVEAHLGIVHKVVDVLEQGLFCGDNLLVEFYDLGVLFRQGEHLCSLGLRQVDEVAGELVQ